MRSTFSQDAIQEFQVVSDSYSAKFGRALGGVINIVTKGGTNDLHGGLFSFIRNDATSTREVFSDIEPGFKQYQFGVTLKRFSKKVVLLAHYISKAIDTFVDFHSELNTYKIFFHF